VKVATGGRREDLAADPVRDLPCGVGGKQLLTLEGRGDA